MRPILSFFFILVLTGCAELANMAGGMSLPQGPPTETEVIAGLKEALKVGIRETVFKTSAENGYLGNALIKIPFPPEAAKMESSLRNLGMNKPVDDFIASMNHAAEKASAEATVIFTEAISQMTFQDAMAIWKGEPDAATQYLKRTTSQKLRNAFQPVVKNSLKEVKVTQYWNPLASAYNNIPFVTPVNPDLESFVTDRALDGLFQMVALEEKKIREDPAARVSDILKRVFGYQG